VCLCAFVRECECSCASVRVDVCFCEICICLGMSDLFVSLCVCAYFRVLALGCVWFCFFLCVLVCENVFVTAHPCSCVCVFVSVCGRFVRVCVSVSVYLGICSYVPLFLI